MGNHVYDKGAGRTVVYPRCSDLFIALGRTYVLNEPYEYHDLLPNPLGGDPFSTRARIILKTFDQQSERAVLSWNQTTDPKQAARILESMIKDLAARRGKKSP